MDKNFRDTVAANNYLWRNRRRMAWGSFFSILIVTLLCFFVVTEERLKLLADVISWFYMAMASIVGAYMGLSTYASVRGSDDTYNPYSGGETSSIDPYSGQGDYNPAGVPIRDTEGDGRGISIEEIGTPTTQKRKRLGRALGVE